MTLEVSVLAIWSALHIVGIGTNDFMLPRPSPQYMQKQRPFQAIATAPRRIRECLQACDATCAHPSLGLSPLAGTAIALIGSDPKALPAWFCVSIEPLGNVPVVSPAAWLSTPTSSVLPAMILSPFNLSPGKAFSVGKPPVDSWKPGSPILWKEGVKSGTAAERGVSVAGVSVPEPDRPCPLTLRGSVLNWPSCPADLGEIVSLAIGLPSVCENIVEN